MRGGYSLLQKVGFSLLWLLLLRSTGSRVHRLQLQRVGSVVVAPELQSTGSLVVVHGLVAGWHVGSSQKPGMELVSSALQGLLTTGPPGKPRPIHLKMV